MAETQIEWLHEAWYIHSCLFHVKTSSKRGRYDPTPHCSVNWGVYTAITPHQRAPNHAIHCLNFLNKKELIGKMILCFLSTVTIYKTGSSQLSSTRALVKTMLFLFGTHAYWIESPVQNLFLVWIYWFIPGIIDVSQYHYWASLLCQKSYLYGAGYVMQMY